jgi:hypothetical protein
VVQLTGLISTDRKAADYLSARSEALRRSPAGGACAEIRRELQTLELFARALTSSIASANRALSRLTASALE